MAIRSVAARYSFAVAVTALAIALSIGLASYLAPMRLFFLWTAVLLTAVVAGFGPAVVSIALSVVAAAVLVGAHSPIDAVRLAAFALFAGGISLAVGFRLRAEERAARLSRELRKSELRYRTLVEATPGQQAVWTATPDGRIAWPDEWIAITGLPRDKIADSGGFGALHPQDLQRTLDHWHTAFETRQPFEDEVRVCIPGGRYRWFVIRAIPVRGDAGEVLEWVGVLSDIHDRKRHEEAASFVNRASDLLTSSLEVEQTLRNLARLCVPAIGDWCAIHRPRADGSYDRVAVEHADPERLQLLLAMGDLPKPPPERDAIIQVLRSGKSNLIEHLSDEMMDALEVTNEQAKLVRQLGFRSWMIAPMNTHGRTVGVLTVVSGESGRRYTQEDLALVEELARRAATAIENAQLYEAAEAANRAKDEFLATLSHELRTPLTAISGWANMLHLGLTDAETTRLAIDTIIRSAKAQGELIDDLLDLSRVVAGTLHLNVTTVNVGEIVEDVIVGARPAAEAKRLQVELRRDPPVVLVRGDERRLRQIVWNLVSNAVKFTEPGGSVRVSLFVRENRARVEVMDTGRGVDPAFLPYVWDRFRQADSSTSRQHGGLGLGLAVVRHLVELHGGTVEARSEGPGRGATFAFEIPVARPLEQRAAPAAVDSIRETLRGRTILVVDDDPDARVVIAAMLRQAGGDVTAVESVGAAVATFASRSFDVVVTDIAMPDEDGYSLLRRIREKSNVPVIAVSAIATGTSDRERVLGAGFTEFVRKPVDPEVLTGLVAAAAA